MVWTHSRGLSGVAAVIWIAAAVIITACDSEGDDADADAGSGGAGGAAGGAGGAAIDDGRSYVRVTGTAGSEAISVECLD